MTGWSNLYWRCCGRALSRAMPVCPVCGRKRSAKSKRLTIQVPAEPASSRESEFLHWWRLRAPELPQPVCQHQIDELPGKPFDLAWPKARLLVEVDGGTTQYGAHNRPIRMHKDNLKRNTARGLGWRVFEVDTLSFNDPDEMIQPIKQALKEISHAANTE